jgi:hypothetical protein
VVHNIFTFLPAVAHTRQPSPQSRQVGLIISFDLSAQTLKPGAGLALRAFHFRSGLRDSRLALLLEQVDERVGAAVVLADLTLAIELAENALGKLLAELDAPLVEGVDVPDGALDESEVLVVGDQRTERTGGDLLGQDRSGGPVAEESLVGNELVGSALGLDGFGGLADHEGLGLCEEVGGKHTLVLVAIDGVVGLDGQDEVGGDELGALVEKLEEGVLGVGTGLTEEDGAGGVLHIVSTAGDSLAVGFHGELLKVCGEAVHVLVVAGISLLVVIYE